MVGSTSTTRPMSRSGTSCKPGGSSRNIPTPTSFLGLGKFYSPSMKNSRSNLVSQFLPAFQQIFLLLTIFFLPDESPKPFNPPTGPRSMTTPSLAQRLSSPRTSTTPLLERLSSTRATTPSAAPKDHIPPKSPSRSHSPYVSLSTSPSPTSPRRARKPETVDDSEEEEPLRHKGKSKQVVPPSPPRRSTRVVSPPTRRPASPLRDHRRPTRPIIVLDEVPPPPRPTPRPLPKATAPVVSDPVRYLIYSLFPRLSTNPCLPV